MLTNKDVVKADLKKREKKKKNRMIEMGEKNGKRGGEHWICGVNISMFKCGILSVSSKICVKECLI